MTAVLVGLVSATSTASSYTVTLYNNLTGGESVTPMDGDYVFVMTGYSAGTNGNPGITAASGSSFSGAFTGNEIAEHYQSSTHDTNISVNYFVYDDTRHRTLTVTGTGSTTRAGGTIVAVFRGINTGLPAVFGGPPYDVVDYVVGTTSGTGILPNYSSTFNPNVNSSTSYNYIWLAGIFSSAGANKTPYTYTFTPSSEATAYGYKGLIAAPTQQGSTSSISCALAWGLIPASTITISYRPGTWTNSGADSSGASHTSFNAYAPQGGGIKARTTGFIAKPVKYWNGSAWITKPLKRWNGSSWVTTKY